MSPCPLCGGSGKLENKLHNPELFKFWENADRSIRVILIGQFGSACEGKWPKDVTDILKITENKKNAYYEYVLCPQCGGIGSAEAFEDELWWEKASSLYDQYGYTIVSGEGDPCDIFAEIYEEVETE